MAPTSKAFVTVLFLSLALCQITAAEPSLKDDSLAKKIVGAITEITTLSNNLRVETEKINVFNAGQKGFTIVEGFTGIIIKVSEATVAISSANNAHASPLSDDDAKLVVSTLTTFVQVHQQLLNVVIGKHGLLTLVPFFEPIRQALVQLEIVVDSFAYALIDLIPTQKPAANSQIASLSVTINAAIETYRGPFSHGDSPVESIQAAFKDLTKVSDDLRVETILKIDDENVDETGPRVVEGLFAIVDKMDDVIDVLDGVSPLSDDDAKLVLKSLATFVQVQTALLDALIEKRAYLTPYAFYIYRSLLTLRMKVNTFATYLIAVIPTQKPAANVELANLAANLKTAMIIYTGTHTAYVE